MKRFRVIVCDPPWPLKKIRRRVRPKQVGFDYPTMSLEDIASLPVGSIAADQSLLFLWTTQKYLQVSFSIVEGWGFSYMLTMAWVKEYGRSNGIALRGFRWNVEFVVVGRRGDWPAYPKQPLVLAGFNAENRGHSIKPDEFYKAVEAFGGPRVDLFARRLRPGWDVWGNEVESTIEFPVKEANNGN